MNTSKIKKAYVVFTLLFFIMSMQLIKAQAVQTPYFVNNNSPACSITVLVEFFDGGSTPCNTISGSVIASGNTGTYNAGGSCGTLTNVELTLMNVGSSPLISSNNQVNIFLQSDTCFPTATGCLASFADIAWSTSVTDIYAAP